MQNKISIANVVMLAGAVVTVVFSFLDFFEGFNAWDTDFLAFASTIPAILALAMAVWIGLELAGVSLPADVLTFNSNQLKATWGATAALIMLSWITVDGDKGAGFWLMFLGSIAMAVGGVMALLGKGTDTVDIPGVGTRSNTAGDTPASAPATHTPPPPPAAPTGGTTHDTDDGHNTAG